ncbi:Charged multivesicular body protein 2A, partial [Bonamia ostreae]
KQIMGIFYSRSFEDIVKEHKRLISKSMRDIDREYRNTEIEEKKLLAELKTRAKKNEMEAAAILAKNIAQVRTQRKKYVKIRADLMSLKFKLSEVASMQMLATSTMQCARSMAVMNRLSNLPSLRNALMQFQRQSEMLGVKQEMLGDMLDGVEIDEDELQEELVSAVLEEVGIEVDRSLVDAPSNITSQNIKTDFENRINRL